MVRWWGRKGRSQTHSNFLVVMATAQLPRPQGSWAAILKGAWAEGKRAWLREGAWPRWDGGGGGGGGTEPKRDKEERRVGNEGGVRGSGAWPGGGGVVKGKGAWPKVSK